MNLEQSEALAVNLEQAAQDKVTLQKKLQDSLKKEGKQNYRSEIVIINYSSFILFCHLIVIKLQKNNCAKFAI